MLALLKGSLITGLVLLNAFFVATEYALLSVRRTRLEQLSNEGNSSAKLVLSLISDMVELFSATQLGITVISLLMGWMGEAIMADAMNIRSKDIRPRGARSGGSHRLGGRRLSADHHVADGAG